MNEAVYIVLPLSVERAIVDFNYVAFPRLFNQTDISVIYNQRTSFDKQMRLFYVILVYMLWSFPTG